MHRFILTQILALFIVLISTSVIAGTHFIVLIDDNQVFKTRHIDLIAKTLPDVLFDGVQKKQNVGTAIPTYRPNIDHLSLVFFGLTKSSTNCKGDPLSIKPEHLFDWESVPTRLHKEKFRQFLTESLGNKCRFKSFVSPIFTAQSLILPFAQTKLNRELLFSKTVLLLLGADNDEKQRDLTYELQDYLNKEIKNKIDAKNLANKVIEKFHFEQPVEGRFTVSNRDTVFLAGGRKDNQATLKTDYPLVYRMTEFRPKISKPEAELSDYRQKIELDRVAVSAQALHIIAKAGENATILRIPTFDDLHPLDVSLQFADNEKKIWQLGEHEFPQYKLLMLDDYQVDTTAKALHIPLFKAITPEYALASTDKQLQPGTIHFTIRFRYNTDGIYDHTVYDTPWHKIDLVPIQPLIIPEKIFFSQVVLDNKGLTEQWMQSDTKGLTQEEAQKRIQNQRRVRYILILSIVFLSVLLLWLYARYSKHPFQPKLQWESADKIEVNFNQQADVELLKIGTLTLKNTGQAKIHLPNKVPSQPSRIATLSLSHQALTEYELCLDNSTTPLGFESAGILVGEIEQTVSDKTSIDIFLALKAITDFEPASQITSNDLFPLPINASIKMKWQENKFSSQNISAEIDFNIQLVPEAATPPQVLYEQRADKDNCYFDLEKKVLVGKLTFKSCARHQFSVPFQAHFTVQAYRDNFPIASQAIVIEGGEQITILYHQTEEKAVSIFCDGELVPNPPLCIPNPDLSTQEYAFKVVNVNFASGSELGPHRFELFREPTPIDIELDIIQSQHTHRIFWGPDDLPRIQNSLNQEPLKDGILKLPPFPNLRFDGNMPPTMLFGIKIGNTGRAGNGFVRVTIIKRELKLAPTAKRIEFRNSFDDGDLFQLVNQINATHITQPIEVKAGNEPITCQVKINTNIIDKIEGARINKDEAKVVVELQIEITDDMGEKTHHNFSIHNPIGLEKLPHPNWLCIDFGTSAITAASGQGNNIRLLPLQKIVPEDNPHLNLADYDPHNEERNINLLPSYVACDADLRQKDSPDTSVRPGFPSYGVKELPRPGDAHFLGLPAGRAKRRESPGRIIFSLKSWLSQLSLHDIVLPEAVTYQGKQQTVTRKELPLDETVESGFAALAEAYLLALPDFQVGQAVICHPNTFSYWHKERLHQVAIGALAHRLKIDLPDERIHLLSESEAVAYYYCRQRIEGKIQQQNAALPPSENILIYDFGAGTVDLSLIRIEWNQEARYPNSWQLKNTLGVPIAGNYLDSILARLIDESLRNPKVLNQGSFSYRFPVVSENLKQGEENDHHKAIYELWMSIRETKQQDNADMPIWGKGDNPFCVNIGNPKQEGMIEEVKTDSTGLLEKLDVSVPPSERCLQFHEGNLYLCIPKAEVHDYPPMQEFIDFLSDTVITELLNGANIEATDVNTVVISGRGAQWPGLCDKIWAKLPNADKADDFIRNSKNAKEAVVRGAIAWQQLLWKNIKSTLPPTPPLGILLDNNTRLKTEDEWQNGIDLTANETFTLVELALKDPKPHADFKSLRRYFYISVAKVNRNWYWKDNPMLMVSSEEQQGIKKVRFENSRGQGIDLIPTGFVGNTPDSDNDLQSKPPWPIGEILLPPEKDN